MDTNRNPTSNAISVQVEAADLTIDFEVPERWASIVERSGPAPLVLLEDDFGQPFRASIVVTVDELPPGVGLKEWQRPNELLLERQSDDYQLLDLERLEVAGREGARRLACYRSPQAFSVTMEQWMMVVGNCGLTATATAATLVFPEYSPTFDQVVSTMRCVKGGVS